MSTEKVPASPKRRLLLKTAVIATGAIAALGTHVWFKRGFVDGHLSSDGRTMIRAIGAALLSGVLPAQPAERKAALDAHVEGMDRLLSSTPAMLRLEIGALLGLLASSPLRMLLTRRNLDWSSAPPAEVEKILTEFSNSSSALVRGGFQGLRDLICMAYFFNPATWHIAGYKGPFDL